MEHNLASGSKTLQTLCYIQLYTAERDLDTRTVDLYAGTCSHAIWTFLLFIGFLWLGYHDRQLFEASCFLLRIRPWFGVGLGAPMVSLLKYGIIQHQVFHDCEQSSSLCPIRIPTNVIFLIQVSDGFTDWTPDLLAEKAESLVLGKARRCFLQFWRPWFW